MPGALKDFANSYNKNKNYEWFAGNIIWLTKDDEVIRCRKGEGWNNLLPEYGILNVYGPSTFIKRSRIIEIGGVNEKLHYMMDTDLWWRLYKSGFSFKRLRKYTWGLRLHKDAKMSGHLFNESDSSNKEHNSWILKGNESKLLRDTYSLTKPFIKIILGKILLFTIRLSNVKYLISLIHTIFYKNKLYTKIKEFSND